VRTDCAVLLTSHVDVLGCNVCVFESKGVWVLSVLSAAYCVHMVYVRVLMCVHVHVHVWVHVCLYVFVGLSVCIRVISALIYLM